MPKRLSVGQYLIDELHRLGVRHVFGVPGDYVLGFFELIEQSPIRLIGTTREDSAGLAADAYARLCGLGVACVTYCAGGLNCLNAIAGAYAEKSPVLLISGAPGMKERQHNPLLHHKVRDFSTQREVYEKVTVANAALEDGRRAHEEIDRVLHAMERYRRPGYIELPRDMVDAAVSDHVRLPTLEELTDERALTDCMSEVVRRVNAAKRPVILADVEVHRFGLQDALVRLVGKTRIPVAAALMGKSVINEEHPLYLGIYEGAMGQETVRRYVEESDCVLMLGCFMTDINLGIYTANIDPSRTIYATSERISVGRHSYGDIPFRSFFAAMLKAPLRRRAMPELPRRRSPWGRPPPGRSRVTVRGLFGALNDFITQDMVVIADIGDSLFGAADLTIHGRTEFLSPAYYTSMGFGVPAALGAKFAAPRLRPLVLVGDGAFQMTGMELSTIFRLGQNPIVVVLNNHGYGTERLIKDGPFNDIGLWDYAQVTSVVGGGRGFRVRTMDDLHEALEAARANTRAFSLLDVDLGIHDTSPALERLGRRLSRRVKGGK